MSVPSEAPCHRLCFRRSGMRTRFAAAERADPAVHRPASHPRGHDPAGVRHAARARAGRSAFPERTFATVDHIVPTPISGGRSATSWPRTCSSALERTAARPASACSTCERRAGHRPRHRAGAWADPAGHDDRVRRQPHLDAWRFRRHRVRHRHVAGARRARVAVPRAGPAEGAPHRGQRQARCAASTRRT